jgi:hypothetical protein
MNFWPSLLPWLKAMKPADRTWGHPNMARTTCGRTRCNIQYSATISTSAMERPTTVEKPGPMSTFRQPDAGQTGHQTVGDTDGQSPQRRYSAPDGDAEHGSADNRQPYSIYGLWLDNSLPDGRRHRRACQHCPQDAQD